MEIKWILIIGGIALFLFVMSKGKGGAVVSRVTADLDIHDPSFNNSRPEAKYTTFKEGQPDKIDIEVENLPLNAGEVLDFYINRQPLVQVTVKRDREAEFEHWSDEEGITFPVITAGDRLDISYQNRVIMSGVFQ